MKIEMYRITLLTSRYTTHHIPKGVLILVSHLAHEYLNKNVLRIICKRKISLGICTAKNIVVHYWNRSLYNKTFSSSFKGVDKDDLLKSNVS